MAIHCRAVKNSLRSTRCLNNSVFYYCGDREQGWELLLRYLIYPVLYLCVGRDQGRELQGVPRDEPED